MRLKDSGIGMDEDDKKKLGQVFFRSSEAPFDDTSYGLGFAHASRIVGLLGGRLDVQTGVGVGTTITIIIPL